MIEEIKVPVTVKRIGSIGIRGADKIRPNKVSLTSEKEKNLVLINHSALKKKAAYTGMSITEDLTIAEQASQTVVG